MADTAHRLIPAGFTPVPSLAAEGDLVGPVVALVPDATEVAAIGHLVAPDAALPPEIGLDRETVLALGFGAKKGQTFVVPRQGEADLVLIGTGTPDERTEAGLRDVVAAFVRAAHRFGTLALIGGDGYDLDPAAFGSAVAEAAVLARYRYTALKTAPEHTPLERFHIVAGPDRADFGDTAAVEAGIREGLVFARSATIARDLANTPPGHLTATVFGDLATELAPRFGLEVETADRAALIELGCGGILGVNAGSTEEPRMIVLRYRPNGGTEGGGPAHLALVGKGIMYDSGGISLKPSDPMHLLMKMDMGGAAAVFGAMTALRDLACPNAVTAYLMCTDNMPSGSAVMLGDVLTIRGGTTVEVRNTDAEGRLVMSDALVLARELEPDAIVDIATLTGAALMALGQSTAAAFGNDQPLVDRVLAAAAATDEPAWQLPLERRYRSQLDSDIADIANLAGKYAGATTAALFLAEFVGDIPWAHLDIAGTMQVDADESWRSKGATGYGARLLTRFALDYRPR